MNMNIDLKVLINALLNKNYIDKHETSPSNSSMF
jgi:hypothetical protein